MVMVVISNTCDRMITVEFIIGFWHQDNTSSHCMFSHKVLIQCDAYDERFILRETVLEHMTMMTGKLSGCMNLMIKHFIVRSLMWPIRLLALDVRPCFL
jgi:hypothetical protein